MKTELKAIIIDDESRCRSALRKQLEWYCEDLSIVGEAENAKQGKALIRQTQSDIIFLDIDMPDQSGINMLQELGDIQAQVIFTTAYDHYAIDAFKVNAVDYLLKPILEDDLKVAVQKVKDRMVRGEEINIKKMVEAIHAHEHKMVAIPLKDGFQFVDKKNIVRLESDGAYCTLWLNTGEKILISKTMKKVNELINAPNMIRVHHSHIVHFSYIEKFIKSNGGYLILKDGSQIPVSRNKKDDFIKAFKSTSHTN